MLHKVLDIARRNLSMAVMSATRKSIGQDVSANRSACTRATIDPSCQSSAQLRNKAEQLHIVGDLACQALHRCKPACKEHYAYKMGLCRQKWQAFPIHRPRANNMRHTVYWHWSAHSVFGVPIRYNAGCGAWFGEVGPCQCARAADRGTQCRNQSPVHREIGEVSVQSRCMPGGAL